MSFSNQIQIAFSLLQNAALVALGVLGFCQTRDWLQRHAPRGTEEILYGLLIGGMGVLSMSAPIDAGSGVRLDLRNAMVVIATVFCGLRAGVASVFVIALIRIWFGGAGAVAGIASLLITYAISAVDILFIRARYPRAQESSARGNVLNLVCLGFAIGLAALATIELFPLPPAAVAVIRNVAPIWILGLAASVTFLGTIIRHYERSRSLLQSLSESEERFRALIEHSSDAVAVIDPAGNISFRSRMASAIVGRTDAEMMGRSILEFAHPDDIGAIKDALSDIARAPEAQASGRTQFRHKDRSWRVLSWSARNAMQVPGVNGIILNVHDVTEASRLEAQLQQAQKMEAVGRLAGGIAHDFNNILGGILGFVGFLLDDLPANSPQRGFALRIQKASERAKELVQQILVFSRFTSVERTAINLSSIARQTKSLLRASLPASTELEIVAEADDVIIQANAGQLSQILINLCVNANHALGGEPGRIVIEITRIAPGHADYALFRPMSRTATDILAGGARSTASSEDAGDAARIVAGALDSALTYARIRVIDPGCGMDADTLGQILDPFYTTKPTGQGTGLGLSVVHGIVMSYGGGLTVNSRPGKGSIFSIYLPLGEPGAVAADASVPDARGSERLLVVDDEIIIGDVLKIGLERLGYAVTFANDPKDALSRFQANPNYWDIVISDQSMPGMKGVKLFEMLRQMRPSLPFILCSGFSDGTTEAGAHEIGIDAFFIKPVSPKQLGACIRSLLAPSTAHSPIQH